MSEQVYDIPLDDSGYSEPFTVEDFIREAETVWYGLSGDKVTIHWNLLKRESQPRQYRPKNEWSLGICRGDGICEDWNFTSKEIHS